MISHLAPDYIQVQLDEPFNAVVTKKADFILVRNLDE
jgi:hypothetical protein